MNRFVLMIGKNITKLPGVCGKLRKYAKDPARYPEIETWNHVKRTLELCVKAGNVDLQVTGLENIPQEGGFMLYGNHQGLFDIMAIGSTCPQPLGAVYKKELKNIPVLDDIMKVTRSFSMDREDVRQSLQVIQAVTQEVKNGRSYLLFPEGTRSKKGNEMNDFHGGSFRCATKAKCPVVPFALIDSFKVLDQKGSDPVTVQLHYLAPIPYEEYKDLKPAQLADLVKDRIQACIDAHI
jgi:1-acyl-sn-glycerol-3-phosphate acyltransferase